MKHYYSSTTPTVNNDTLIESTLLTKTCYIQKFIIVKNMYNKSIFIKFISDNVLLLFNPMLLFFV